MTPLKPSAVLFAGACLCLCGCPNSRTTPPLTTANPPAAAAPAPPPAPPAQQPEMVREQAKVGVGEKGRGVGDGLILTPLKTYFAAKEMITFTIEVPKALEAYKIEHDGKTPPTEAEYMEKVIKANGIELPQLPAGHKYVYDVEKAELMVEHPK